MIIRITIDTEKETLTIDGDEESKSLELVEGNELFKSSHKG